MLYDPLKGTPLSAFQKEAKAAFEKNRVAPISFSHATYQFKVIDPDLPDPVWTFLQFQQQGGVEDAFCSCSRGDDKEGCWHLAASLLRVFNRTPLPLHLRFEKSSWHDLGVRLWSEMEGGAKEPELIEETIYFYDRAGSPLLLAQPQNETSVKELRDLFYESEATEENSIKFSNLSEEELLLWREGRPPPSLQFELSLLSDLMKWCFLKEEEGKDPMVEVSLSFPQGGGISSYSASAEPLYSYDESHHVLKEGAKEWSGTELSFLLDQKLREGSMGELGIPFERERVPLTYHLEWRNKATLVIQSFLKSPNDVTLHGGWGYVKERGFIPLKEPQFLIPAVEISREEIADFVLRHKIWLSRQKGFETHLLRSQSLLSYEVNAQGNLKFIAKSPETEEGWIDCGGFLYFEGEGFFPREGPVGRNHPFNGRIVEQPNVAAFIEENHDLLLNVPGFFANVQPFDRFGLKLTLKDEKILIEPHIKLSAPLTPEDATLFGPYIYVNKKGFFPLTMDPRIPPEYLTLKEIHKKEFDFFFRDVFPFLQASIVESSKELVPLKEPMLLLTKFSKIVGGRIRGALLIKGKEGVVDPFSLKGRKERFLLTEAGLIDQQDVLLEWIHDVETEMPPWRWLKLFLLLNPVSDGLSSKEKKLLDRLLSLEGGDLPPLEGFEATLRSYQEVGVKWLYHLYERGFSGLLADDMGLGKTLQALALIAALKKKKKKLRCLIICPTSVLFHWKDKIEAFLPGVSYSLFHGIKRELDDVRKRKVPLLITSYGVVKRDLNKLKKIPFDLIIFDEIQMAKNHTSRLWESLCTAQRRHAGWFVWNTC